MAGKFIEVALQPHREGRSQSRCRDRRRIRIDLADGTRLRIDDGVDAALVGMVVALALDHGRRPC